MIALLLGTALAHPPVILNITGLPSAEGTVLCTLYGDPALWLADPGYIATAESRPEDGGKATCTFDDVPPGTYAATFLHDANSNQDMDTNWLGLPKEAWGVSNDAPAFLGPPAFEDAAFVHPGERVRASGR